MSQFVLKENSDGSVSLNKKTQVLAEICGKVNYVNNTNKTLFSIHTEKLNKKYRCKLNYPNPFCPLREGDAVFGIAEYFVDPQYGETLNIIQPPFVVPGEDKSTIIDNFTAALRGTGFGTMKAHSLLQELELKCGSLISSIQTLDRLSSHFFYKNESDNALLQPYGHILKEKQMLQLLQWWYKNRNLRRLYLFGLTNTEIKNSKISPEDLYKLCLDNPYKIFTLSLDKCDSIANRIGKNVTPEVKYCAEIARKLNEFMEQKGWTGVPTSILLNIYPQVATYIESLRKDFDVKTELHTVYLPYAHEVEVGICDLVRNLLDAPVLPHAIRSSEITYTRNDLTDDQKTAIQHALQDNICVIRGIAGCGKSTIIKELIHNLKSKGIKYRVVSFTGKAVARIREITEQKEPMTMHMSITLGNKKSTFSHLIIDEASMVTSELLYEFVKKFGNDYRITLVGDPNQLQPIGWGMMFEQIIKSGIVPVYNLRTCHRVGAANSGILLNANNIVECNSPGYNGPPFQFEDTPDFTVVDGDISTVKELLMILQNQGIDSRKITVISPYNKYLEDINKLCQKIYNETNRSVADERGVVWKINDRVMMTENNYKINIMNGDEGYVTDITATQVQVTFKDGTSHVFLLTSLENEPTQGKGKEGKGGKEVAEKVLTTESLVHSFAVSVHRYQGSECDYVIFFVPQSPESKFLNRNLLYTGITRAKKFLWMVGDAETMVRAATTVPAYRCDNLARRLVASQTIELAQY